MERLTRIESELISSSGTVLHGFLGRTGGVSPPPFHSLNLSSAVGDGKKNVERNLKIVEAQLGISKETMVILKQTHSDHVICIEDTDGCGIYKDCGDALVTQLKGVTLCVLTADCVPIIVVDRAGSVAAIIHAGWRGTLKGIAINTVNKIKESFGIEPKQLVAAIGPSIAGCCYTVSRGLLERFRSLYPDADGIEPDSCRIDLRQINRWQLALTGLEDIDTIDICTSCSVDRFFSHRKEGTTGRQMNFVSLRG